MIAFAVALGSLVLSSVSNPAWNQTFDHSTPIDPLLARGTSGLVAHYPLDGDPDDDSGNGNHGVAHGGVSYLQGVAGLSASFDGINDYLEIPRSIQDSFSIAFWVRTVAVAPAGIYWFHGLGLVDMEVCGSPPGGDWGIAMINGGKVIWGSLDQIESTADINDDSWHAVVVTREVPSGEVALYVDGVEQGRGQASPPTPITGSSWIGVANNPCDAAFSRLWFPGLVDELRLYDRVLSRSEIVLLSGGLFADGFESGNTIAWTAAVP